MIIILNKIKNLKNLKIVIIKIIFAHVDTFIQYYFNYLEMFKKTF